MNIEDIVDLYDLANYLNECESWPDGIEGLCESKGWKYHRDPWSAASYDGKIVTINRKSKVYEVIPYKEEKDGKNN